MKQLFILIVVVFSAVNLSAQNLTPIAQYESDAYLNVIGSYEPIAKFVVIYATRNGQEISHEAQDAGVYTLFYRLKESGKLGMANVSGSNQTLSYGPIYEVTKQTSYVDPIPTTIYQFEWDYQNSFDSGRGTCKVRFEVDPIEQGTTPEGMIGELRFVDEESEEMTQYKEVMTGSTQFELK